MKLKIDIIERNDKKPMIFKIEEIFLSSSQKVVKRKYHEMISYIRYLQIKDELFAKRLRNNIFQENHSYYSFVGGRLSINRAKFYCSTIERYLIKQRVPLTLKQYRKLNIY